MEVPLTVNAQRSLTILFFHSSLQQRSRFTTVSLVASLMGLAPGAFGGERYLRLLDSRRVRVRTCHCRHLFRFDDGSIGVVREARSVISSFSFRS